MGSAVAVRALREGWEVSALTRNAETCRQLEAKGCAQVVQDSLESRDWHEEFSRADVVLNCVSSAGGGLEGYRRSYVQGQESVLAWLKQKGTGCYIYTGATSVYPQSSGETVDEDDVPEDALLSENGQVLRQSERMVQNGAENAGKAVILRLSGIYGPQRHWLLDQLRDGKTVFPGSGDRYLNLIFLPDIVNAVWKIIHVNQPHDSIFNVTDDGSFTKREMIEWLAGRLGLANPQFDPEQSSLRDSRRKSEGALPNRIVSNARIRKQIGWRPLYPDFKAGYECLLGST